MTLKEYIEDKLSGMEISYSKPSSDFIMEVMQYGTVSLMMDSKTQDYFYQISIDELEGSNAPEALIDDFADGGWSLDEEHKHIIIFLTN